MVSHMITEYQTFSPMKLDGRYKNDANSPDQGLCEGAFNRMFRIVSANDKRYEQRRRRISFIVAIAVIVVIAVSLTMMTTNVLASSARGELSTRTITVNDGDTLWSICATNPVAGYDTYELVQRTMSENNLASADIYPGQELRIYGYRG